MVRHNNEVSNQHFRKEWQLRVKTWFNQPMRKRRRRLQRAAKAAKIAPRPMDHLRPVVHCQTVKYNTKLRKGRGFTLDELKEAGITKKYARTVGIAVDHRRKNRCVESLQTNVQRLKEYKSKLIVFPRKPGKVAAGEASAEEVAVATQLKTELMPIEKSVTEFEARAITDDEKQFRAYGKLRLERMNARQKGARDRKAREAEAEKK
uniref:60S ribosomal protein L13 n=1 Tax=Rhodosorus marinus TaxID=101924 RepID=A0A7S0G8A5_9RHOD|mmetsp:Transcript_5986/g.8477  ORF Transcript_5986/g.8477 Transcript_5986/m.8477 type:complete len:206 (+) Transcript_5986:61-678(+)